MKTPNLNIMVFCTQLLLSATIYSIDNSVSWKYGIAFIQGQPAYIDYEKLDQREMLISEYSIKKYTEHRIEIIAPGKLLWGKNSIKTFSTKVNNPYRELFETKTIYHYRVTNNRMYLSKDGKAWEELFIKIVDDKPRYGKPRIDPPVYMIIHLKCKWFEGEFELIGTTG